MRTVYINTPNPFGEFTNVIKENNWIVYNAPRPIPGERTWQGEFRHGIFYATGALEQYRHIWEDLDAWPVKVISNKEIREFLENEAKKAGTTLEEAIKFSDIEHLADSYGLPWNPDTSH